MIEYNAESMSKHELYASLAENPQRAVGIHPQSGMVVCYTSWIGNDANRSIRRSAATELFGRPITKHETLRKLKAIGRCDDKYKCEYLIEDLLRDLAGG